MMVYVLGIVIIIAITFLTILCVILHYKKKANLKVELDILGIKTYMEVTEDESVEIKQEDQ